MDAPLTRRSLLGAGLALPVLGLAGCATLGDIPGMAESIRRLLTLSSQRAFARLVADEGFFQDDLARVTLPSQLGGSAITRTLAVLLGTRLAQDRLMRLVNDAAADGARAAAPVVYDSIRNMSIADAATIVRGGSTAATAYLQRDMGDRIFDVMFPGVGNALRLADNGVINRVLGVATGINFAGLQADVTRKAADGVYRAIGREEAAIRANPQSTNDPVLAGVFGLIR